MTRNPYIHLVCVAWQPMAAFCLLAEIAAPVGSAPVPAHPFPFMKPLFREPSRSLQVPLLPCITFKAASSCPISA